MLLLDGEFKKYALRYAKMDGLMTDFDWHVLKSFALVGEHGSLSAAARAAGISQSTMSRHLSTLEKTAGSRLVERTTSGIILTSSGLAMLDYVEKMSDAASQLSYSMSSRSGAISGSVRITASEFVAAFVLPEILSKLRIEEPEIDFEVVASDATDNLLRRDADIAIRMYRPTQLDLISRKVGDLKLAAFASNEYIERRGNPSRIEDLFDHNVIGYDRNQDIIDGFRAAGLKIDSEFFAFRCDTQFVCWQMILAGYGIGFFPTKIGQEAPNITKIIDLGDVGSLPIWLTAHSELKSSQRLRRVYDFLAVHLDDAYQLATKE